MTNYASRIPVRIADNVYIGDPPSATYTGQPAARSMSHQLNYRYGGSLFSYSGPPDKSINPGTTNVDGQDYINTFYIINKTVPRADASDRQMGGVLLPWHAATRGSTTGKYVRWAKDYTVPGTYNSVYTGTIAGVSQEVDYGDDNAGKEILLYDGLTYAPDSGGDFVCGILSMRGIMPAAINLFEAPDRLLVDAQKRINEADVAAGTVIRGYNATTKASLGHMMHWVGNGDADTETLESNLRSAPLFQWGHGKGIYINGGTSYSSAINDYKIGVRFRNAFEVSGASGYLRCYPAMVVSTNGVVNSSARVRMHSVLNNSYWEYDFDGSESNPTLITAADGLSATYLDCFNTATGGNYEAIEVDAYGGAGGEVIIHSMGLWPGPLL